MQLTEETLSSEPIYDGVLLHIKKDMVRLPNGDITSREWMKHGGAAGVIAVENDGRILMVRQFRYPLRQVLLEIPAGKLEPGEDPEAGARRELEEETGRRAGRMTKLATMTPSPAYTTEMLYLYLAENLTETGQRLDDDEFLAVEHMTVDELSVLLDRDEIIDGKTQIALLRYLRYLQNKA